MSNLLLEPVFWFAVSFVLFFVIFGPKIWKPLAGMLDARADQIRVELDEAARLRREAEQMLEDATREREQAYAEASALIEQSRKQAEDLANKARLDAEDMLRRREQMAKDRIAAAERTALEDVRAAAVDAAFEGARLVMQQSIPAQTSTDLVDSAIAGLPTALSPRAA
ncbi:F0F1 ATP synthase subunit B [Acetobacter oeni]|uniref:ATP synthase subunit b n=1 Tax=Acetobacter oeni TaxID=304077 RepID=A0A511XIE6_9PROT|nr:F0F1 ATP synthase subunit B [Acetobacter oeni]MBB3881436.1 F-type H+-transporting ATPase subunit b [Acetobacter oeni]NHO18301.1 F0F1 ATP synthase subunit B [Acetobacter oeni]GBR10997.1 ATP synthase F0 subunit beta' [Acetobacter oeni LMG 21952]GEN62713.1 ATP synthase subunit b [Acetobacter oeni]